MDTQHQQPQLPLQLPLQWPLLRNYSDIGRFSRRNIDLFYDLVERMYYLVFVKQFISTTSTSTRRYMENPRIMGWNFHTNIIEEEIEEGALHLRSNSYFFEVAHELTFSTGVVPCLLKIQLKPYHRRDYPYRPEVYLEIRNRTDEDGRILPNVFFECFGGPDVYNDIALLTNNNEDHGTRRREARNEDPLRTYDIDVIDSEDFVNVFEIWLSIDKNYKTKMHLDTEYKYKYCEYFKSLAEIRHFKYVQMRAFVSVMIPGKGPSHQVKPYFTQAVSEGQILDMIGQQGGIHSWFPDLMKRLFPR